MHSALPSWVGTFGTWRNKIEADQKKSVVKMKFTEKNRNVLKGCDLVSAEILLNFLVPDGNF
jgi:hypothetical protein